jgi:glycosyltransferase involved in cell wall biosynthesis
MLSALRQLASRVRSAFQRVEPPLDLHDLSRLNGILAEAGQPPLAAPPVADLVRGERAMRVFELAPELRDGAPLALTPSGREAFLRWAVFHSSGAHRVSADEVLALLAYTDRLPDRGLEWTYRLTPAWQQAVPDALTPGGWERLKEHLRVTYNLNAEWLRDASLANPQSPDVGRGVNVLAHFDYPSGLQQAADVLVQALHRAGFETSLRDLPFDFRPDALSARKVGLERFDTSIVVAAVNSFAPEWYRKAGLWVRPGVRRIAVWYWELERIPAEWGPQLGWADEVWAPTRFIADALRKVVTAPVRVMSLGLELPPFTPLPRSHFGLPDDRTLFLFAFDMASRMPRKNPLGLVEAFRRAFRPDEPAELVIKTSRGHDHPTEFDQLRRACEANGVRLIDSTLPRPELLALMRCCDCFVSLHRSEGLGLGMAEAMLMGKPVIATAYSGNLDFMTADAAYLVRAGRVACGPGVDPYPPDMHWGDPDLQHAAELLRRVYDHPAEATATGARAARHTRDLLSIDAYARRVAEALVTPK